MQKTIIDRCVRLVYQTYLNDPRPENMPVLEDLYNPVSYTHLPKGIWKDSSIGTWGKPIAYIMGQHGI